MLVDIPTNEFIDGVSRNPDLKGARQRIDGDALPNLLAFAEAFYRMFGRPLEVTEGARSRPRQQYLWDNRVRLGISVARPFLSRHDEVNHPTAVDLGSGIATAGTPAADWAHTHGAVYGVTWTGEAFSPSESWHHEVSRVPVAAASKTPTNQLTTVPMEDDMKLLYRKDINQYLLVGFTGAFSYPAAVGLEMAKSMPWCEATKNQWDTEAEQANERGKVLRKNGQ